MHIRLSLFLICLYLSACSFLSPADIEKIEPTQEQKPVLTLEETSFNALEGWPHDRHSAALIAFSKSCNRILKRDPATKFGAHAAFGSYGDWQPVCKSLFASYPKSDLEARQFFETYFTPWKASDNGDQEGLFTGYYEPSLKGSRQKSETYQTPLYKRPDDLVMVDLGQFRDSLKGERIAGRVIDGKLKPYEARADIVAGSWPYAAQDDQIIAWVDSEIDAFFLQIQGSGRVKLDSGEDIQVGYAGQNGHVYYAIGRELIKRGHLTKENVSLQSIEAWLKANPDQADEIMNLNASYVFFTELDGAGPLGAEGLPLTPGRSLAIDRSLLAYGLPVWLQINESPAPAYARFSRLMVAQDTGGAIRGPVRGDVFWGHGDEAEFLAGQMKAKGQYWLLLPSSIAP